MCIMQTVISNATRWDTFEYLMEQQVLPRSEELFRKRYKKSPSFISIHMGVKADVLPKVSICFNDHMTIPEHENVMCCNGWTDQHWGL